MIGRPEDIRSYRIVISSEVETSFSFAVWKRMFGNSKRETCYPQCFRASPHIYSRRSRHYKFESRNRASSIPFLWKGNARRARGWSRERKVPSQPPPLRATSFQRKEGKQRSGIILFILCDAFILFCAEPPFLISNSSFEQRFHPKSRGDPPCGLTLNPPTVFRFPNNQATIPKKEPTL